MYGYSRQSYYQGKQREEREVRQRERILGEVRRIRRRQPRSGARKLQMMVNEELMMSGIRVGRDRLFGLLREEGLLVRKRKKWVRTTQSGHGFRVYKNLIKEKEVKRPGEVLVSDITYIKTMDGWSYLSLVTDLYSRKIMGYELSTSLTLEGSLRALRRAIKGIEDPRGTIHHSDRGVQYCSHVYVGELKKRGMEISMTEENHCYENAVAERVNGILKEELLLGAKIISHGQAQKLVKEAIGIYNNERLHSSLGYQTPAQRFAA